MPTGFLITSLSGKLRLISDIVNQHVLKKLYIYVSLNKNQPNLRNSEWTTNKIVDLYSSSFQLFPDLDVRIILNDLKLKEEQLTKIKDYNIDLIIMPKNFDAKKICDFSKNSNLCVVYVDGLSDDEKVVKTECNKIYKQVVLGGTFDRLHTGHKILLSQALLRCSNKLTVGVTDGNMIKGKKLWELIQPSAARIEAVQNFIKEVDGTVSCDVVPITDMYGPTKSDPNLDMIVVSAETERGGHKVNELRKEKGLNELDMYVVNLAEDSQKNSEEEEEKISSSNIRMRLLGTYIRVPEVNPNLPAKPYVIGLTGGVASGKSSICEYLKTLGVTVIDCDKLAHELYKPQTELYFALINLFGKEIISPSGEINRRVLGCIVFNDREKLDKLNNLMWPAILKAAKEECQRLYREEKVEIVVLEAAVLLKAGWQEAVHEVWGTIIPKKEAISRIMTRNKLSEAEAVSRVEAQSTNIEIVENANVVFCSLWSHEFTRSQVLKAWLAVQGTKE